MNMEDLIAGWKKQIDDLNQENELLKSGQIAKGTRAYFGTNLNA